MAPRQPIAMNSAASVTTCAPAVRMEKASGSRTTGESPWAIADSRSSTSPSAAPSPWPAPMASCRSPSTARSTTTAPSGSSSKPKAASFGRTPTPKSCFTSMPRRARPWSTTYAACSPSVSGTRSGTPCCSPAIPTASNPCTTPRTVEPYALHRKSRRCAPAAQSPMSPIQRESLVFTYSAAYLNPTRSIAEFVRCPRAAPS